MSISKHYKKGSRNTLTTFLLSAFLLLITIVKAFCPPLFLKYVNKKAVLVLDTLIMLNFYFGCTNQKYLGHTTAIHLYFTSHVGKLQID